MNIVRPALTVEYLRETLPTRTVESMRAIVKDSFERLAQVQERPSLLTKGVWNPADYIRAYRSANLKDIEGLPPQEDLNRIVWGYAPSSHFVRYKDPIGRPAPMKFVVRPEVSASEALDAAIEGPTLTDCGGACQLATLKALRDTIGKDLFDEKFKGKLCLGVLPDLDPLAAGILKPLEKVEKQGKKVFQMSTGKWAAIPNRTDYMQKHRFGPGHAYNLIYAGKGRYLGLGLDSNGVTFDQVNELLVHEFNKPPSTDLNGLVSGEEYRMGMIGLILMTGKVPIKENLQIKVEDLRGVDPEGSFEYDYEFLANSFG